MTEYREILRLHSLGHSIRGIALSVPCARNTAARTVKLAKEANLEWQQARNMTDGEIECLCDSRKLNKDGKKVLKSYLYYLLSCDEYTVNQQKKISG